MASPLGDIPGPGTLPAAVCRRFEAVLFDWCGTAVEDPRADARAIRLAVESVCSLGLDVAVLSTAAIGEVDGQLGARPHGPGALHLLVDRGREVFLVGRGGPVLLERRRTDESEHTALDETRRWWLSQLWRCGVWPQQALIVGHRLGPLAGAPAGAPQPQRTAARATLASVAADPPRTPPAAIQLGGGPERMVELLRLQAALRRHGALPVVAQDPSWTLRVDAVTPERERGWESLLTLADGRLGTRGSVLSRMRASRPGVLLAGAYRGRGERSELQPAPLWNRIAGEGFGRRSVRTLDLRAGLLWHQVPGGRAALQFSSLARPGVAVLSALGPRDELAASPPLEAPPGARVELHPDRGVMRITTASGALEAAAAQSLRHMQKGDAVDGALERFAAYDFRRGDVDGSAAQALGDARAAGRERLLCEHRRAWARRWQEADVRIEGDEELQLAVRVALYHLIASVADHGEAAVGARALSGTGYRGHVFWDSDVFVLPFLAATHPAGARAILEYRVRRLPAALAAARASGRRGARFAWESADGGEDVTPHETLDRAGRMIDVHTGQREEHIVADVAWAAACYLDWTGDAAFRAGAGRVLLVQTARYWASRIERDEDGSAHIRGVIGPDEYHELVDDNAYTNVMARWNLRRALAEASDEDLDPGERAVWAGLAEALVDGYRPDTGVYEQFAGFAELEPLVIADLAQRPIAAELLLGPERVSGAQIVKQADVLMLHHLVPGELAAGSLVPNLDFYEPRTAHASTLSPGIHASLFARAGRLDRALEALRLAARIDLEDISRSGAAGVHIAAMGSVWQALAFGFLGARADGEVLRLDPLLPGAWEALELRLCFRGAAVGLHVGAEEMRLSVDGPIRVSLAGGPPRALGAGTHRLPVGGARSARAQ